MKLTQRQIRTWGFPLTLFLSALTGAWFSQFGNGGLWFSMSIAFALGFFSVGDRILQKFAE